MASTNKNVVGNESVNGEEKQLSNLANIQVVFSFMDNMQSIVPLTPLQAAFMVQMLGFTMDEKMKSISHYTDAELNELYKLLTPEEFEEMGKKNSVFQTNPK